MSMSDKSKTETTHLTPDGQQYAIVKRDPSERPEAPMAALAIAAANRPERLPDLPADAIVKLATPYGWLPLPVARMQAEALKAFRASCKAAFEGAARMAADRLAKGEV